MIIIFIHYYHCYFNNFIIIIYTYTYIYIAVLISKGLIFLRPFGLQSSVKPRGLNLYLLPFVLDTHLKAKN